MVVVFVGGEMKSLHGQSWTHVELFDPTIQKVKDGKIGGHIYFQDEESFQMSYRTYL